MRRWFVHCGITRGRGAGDRTGLSDPGDAVVAIAEGIESNGQLASLRGLGCDLAQGFLFARPMPAGQVRGLLTGGFGDLMAAGAVA